MNSKISKLELGVLSNYLLKSTILINGINILINNVSNDAVVSIIIGFLIGFIYLYSLKKLNKKSVFYTIEDKFPKIISLIIKLLLIIPILLFSSYLLYSVSLFIKSALLNNMDILAISVLFIISLLYISFKGITTISRSSFICFFIFILLEILMLILVFPNIDSLKILPLFTHSISNIITNSFSYSILSFFPLFLILAIPKNCIQQKEKDNKYIKIFYIATNLYIIFNFILVFSIVDIKLASIIDYPELFALSKISILNFFDRMEGILSFKFIFDIFFTLAISVFYIKEGINSIIKKEKDLKAIISIICIILLFLSNYLNFSSKFVITSLAVFGITNIFISIFISLFDY